MKVCRTIFVGVSLLIAAGAALPAYADQLEARVDQAILNADSTDNGSILGGAWGAYFGQTLASQLGVMERERPDYDPKGIPLGGFRLFPTLTVGGGYTNNVFYTPQASSDWLAEYVPAASLRSQWGRDSLVFYGAYDAIQYGSQSSQNTKNWDVGGSGDFEIGNNAHLRGNVYYDTLDEQRTSPNFPGLVAKPVPFSLFHSDASVSYHPGRLGFSIGAALDEYRYSNAQLIGGGILPEGGRDENIYALLGRVTYDFSPGYAGFISASYENRNFLEAFDLSGVNRDSTGLRANAGVEFVLGHLIEAQVFAGFLSQNFTTTALNDVHAFNYGVNANWYVTPLVTLHFGAVRNIDDTTLAGASASDDQIFYMSADYEFRRNIILQGELGYTDSIFVGTSRHDTIPSADLKVIWLLNHYVSVDAHYDYQRRNSNAPGQDYSRTQVLMDLRLQI